MKKLLFYVLCFFAISTMAQNRSINNQLSSEHIFISSTKIALIPPPDFTKAMGFNGFQQVETNSSILANEIPAPYAEITKAFTAEALKTRGVILIKSQEVSFQKLPAKLLTTTQSANGIDFAKIIFVFGDAKKVFLVNFMYPASNKALEAQMEKALNSLVYQSTKQVNPLEEANFKINTTNSGFTFAHALSGALIFTSDGKLPPLDPDKAMITVAQTLVQSANIQDKKAYAIATVQKFPNGQKTKVEKVSPIEIDGMSGYEIVGAGENEKGQKELVYEVVLYTNTGYYQIVGLTPSRFEHYQTIFQQVAKSFERKL